MFSLANFSRTEMDMAERIIRGATTKSKDGRIDQVDFLNYAAAHTRYALFSPMEVSIIFHFAGRGGAERRLAFIDFASLLDPRWRAPGDEPAKAATASGTTNVLSDLMFSTYNFVLGGMAGAFGATMVYPIDLGECCFLLLVPEQ